MLEDAGLLLKILTNFLSSEADSLGFLPDFDKVVTHLNNIKLFLHLFRNGPLIFWIELPKAPTLTLLKICGLCLIAIYVPETN